MERDWSQQRQVGLRACKAVMYVPKASKESRKQQRGDGDLNLGSECWVSKVGKQMSVQFSRLLDLGQGGKHKSRLRLRNQ